MDPVINKAKPDEANTNNLVEEQPWKAFIDEPEVRPFAAKEGGNSVMRLKTEKDEHGLGG